MIKNHLFRNLTYFDRKVASSHMYCFLVVLWTVSRPSEFFPLVAPPSSVFYLTSFSPFMKCEGQATRQVVEK